MNESMRKIPLVLLLWALTGTARARLGETMEQCTERYGPVIEKRQRLLPQSDTDTAVFSKSGVTIVVEFHQGLAWHITFRKPIMQDEEIDALLQANASGGKWSVPLKYGDAEYRLAGDRKRMAVSYFAEKGVSRVEVMLREYSELYRANYLARLKNPTPSDGSKNKTNPLPGF